MQNQSSEEVSAPISYKDQCFNIGTYVTSLDASSHLLNFTLKIGRGANTGLDYWIDAFLFFTYF